MIGMLGSTHMKKKYKELLHSLVKEHRRKGDESIIFFTIPDIDFNRNTVNGILISENETKLIRTQVPPVIFNMAVQRDIKSIKGRIALEDMEGIKLFNALNRYDQWMLMEILSSSVNTKKYLLQYNIYDKQKRDYKPEGEKAYIVMPAKGSSLSRIIFTQPELGSERVGGTQYFKKGHICDYIDASLCQKRWLFIETPELMMHDNRPNVVRVHLQKGTGGVWNILGKDIYPETGFKDIEINEIIDNASLTAVMYINHYLLDLGYCFIDFVISTDGNPYFLHFGGFNLDFFYQEREEDFYINFYRNLINLTGYYGISARGGLVYVD